MRHSFIVLAAALHIFLAGPAQAEDAASQNPLQFYAGIFAGGAAGFADESVPVSPPSHLNGPVSGYIGGIFVGVDFVKNKNLLLGIEADVFTTNLTGSATNTALPGSALTVMIDRSGSLRGRVGYVQDQTTFFLTAGLSAASIETELQFRGVRLAGPERSLAWGIIAGAGVDHEFEDGWFGRAMYTYTHFLPTEHSAGAVSPTPSFQVSAHNLSAGFGKRFD